MEREIDNHNAVLLYDSHEKKQTDHGIKRESRTEKPEGEQTTHDRGEKRGENRDGVHIALVEDAENDIHNKQSGKDKKRKRLKELLENQAFSLKLPLDGRRQSLSRRLLNKCTHITQSVS
jgi:hypothetical protein